LQEALDQNQQYASDIALIQEDMQALLIQMDAAKRDQTDSEVALAQERLLTSQLSQDKINLELTMQNFNKAYDELEATKNALMSDKSRLEKQLEEAIKSAQVDAAGAAAEHQKAHKALLSQLETSRASIAQESEQAIASKDQALMMLEERWLRSNQMGNQKSNLLPLTNR